VLEWCEIPSSEDCALDVVCPGPTERIVIAYDPVADAYPTARATRIRPPVEGMMSWEGDTCVRLRD
jgi:hypothetical protein